ncbi:uncharacterized protein [Setaria viridis]
MHTRLGPYWAPSQPRQKRERGARSIRRNPLRSAAPEEERRRFAPAMDRDGRPGWLPSLGFAFLSFNCGMAVYRSWDDPSSVAFVVVAYVALILLFRCLHLLERAGPGHRGGQGIKLAVWGLSTLLTLMFSSKVADIMPLWAQLLVWAMGIFTIVAGFYAFFLARPDAP